MTNQRRLPECYKCQFISRSQYVVCAVHPSGPKSDRCLDFRHDPKIAVEAWAPQGYSWYGGALIASSERLTQSDRLNLLDNHPLFTGRCPECDRTLDTSRIHWDCDRCGWMDDSVV